MANLSAIVRSINIQDFPKVDPELLRILNVFMNNVADAIGGGGNATIGGGLSFHDNFQCDIINATITHGVVINVLPRKVRTPKSVLVLGSDGEIPSSAIVVPRSNGTADVYVWFNDPDAANVKASLCLIGDGTATTTVPAFRVPVQYANKPSGGDDTLMIQKLINKYSEVHLSSGTYKISGSGLSLPSGHGIIGQGPQATILNYSGAGACITMDGCQSSYVTMLEVIVTGGTGTERGILVTNTILGSQKNLISNCQILQNNATARIAGQKGIYVVDVNGSGAAQYWNRIENCNFLNWDICVHYHKNGGTNGANQNFISNLFFSSSNQHVLSDGGCNDNTGHGLHGTHSSVAVFADVVVTIGDGATTTGGCIYTGIISDMGANGSAFNLTAGSVNNVVIAVNESSGTDVDSGGGNYCISSKNLSGLNQRFRIPNFATTTGSCSISGTLLVGKAQQGDHRAAGAVGITYSVNDRIIGHTGLAGAITDTLPNAFVGGEYIIKDEDGSASGANTITLAAAAGQTIDGAASIVIINSTNGSARVYSAGGTKWFTW